MPKSKKPRKKGMSAEGRKKHLAKRILRGNFKSAAQMNKAIDDFYANEEKNERKKEQVHWMIAFTDKSALIEAFTRSLFALDRWPTTHEFKDFNCVSSSLTLGAMLHRALGVQEVELLKDIQHAAFMTVVCARLRNHKKELPASNLDPVKHGLIISQELMEYAYEHDRQSLINVLKCNSKKNLDENPDLELEIEKFLLGDRYELVAKWEDEDEPTQKFE